MKAVFLTFKVYLQQAAQEKLIGENLGSIQFAQQIATGTLAE